MHMKESHTAELNLSPKLTDFSMCLYPTCFVFLSENLWYWPKQIPVSIKLLQDLSCKYVINMLLECF